MTSDNVGLLVFLLVLVAIWVFAFLGGLMGAVVSSERARSETDGGVRATTRHETNSVGYPTGPRTGDTVSVTPPKRYR